MVTLWGRGDRGVAMVSRVVIEYGTVYVHTVLVTCWPPVIGSATTHNMFCH